MLKHTFDRHATVNRCRKCQDKVFEKKSWAFPTTEQRAKFYDQKYIFVSNITNKINQHLGILYEIAKHKDNPKTYKRMTMRIADISLATKDTEDNRIVHVKHCMKITVMPEIL